DVLRHPWLKKNRKKITELDCSNHVVLPGFVDSHTHPAFIAPRLVDFEKRSAGATYEEIANAGGGIRASVELVRKATKGDLAAHVVSALNQMAAQGTTTVEAKSGYGLNLAAEVKSLEAIHQASSQWPGTVVPTFLGAHVCQLTECVLWPLLEYHPASFDHMDHVMEEDIPQLASHDTVLTLVPGANYFLGLEEFPPARTLIDAGAPVALATDYNPGSSPTPSMPLVLSLACTRMRMSPAEAIAAATINGAHALRLSTRKGSIETGKDADL